MIPLPNTHWVRSTTLPNYAVCFDRDDKFFCWKMVENPGYDKWESVALLSTDELHIALQKQQLKSFHPCITSEIERRAIAAAPTQGKAVEC